jgi:hypothetical protein
MTHTGHARVSIMRPLLAGALLFAVAAGQERTMGLMQNDPGACPGYTLFAPVPYTVTYLIDINGELVQSWPSGYYPALSALLAEDGELLRTRTPDTSGANGVEDIGWDGTLQWSRSTAGRHHDITQLPDGNLLLIVSDRKTRAEAVDAGRDPARLLDEFILPDKIIELDPRTDSVVWEWRTWDHLVQDYDSAKQNYGAVGDHPELVDVNYAPVRTADWMHSNSIVYHPGIDQVMLSVRYFSEFWVIDHGTTTGQASGHSGGRYGRGGDLLYRWGNPQAYRRGSTADQRLFWQHDAQWIADSLPGDGNILVFNNGNGRPGGEHSSVEEFRPPVDSLGFYRLEPGAAWGPESAAWSFADTVFANSMSSCQRLANGNTLICYATTGTFVEVTPERRPVWRYISPVTVNGPRTQGETIPAPQNRVFRVRRYSPDFAAFRGRSLEPQGPIEHYPQAVADHAPGRAAQLGVRPNPAVGNVTVRYALPTAGAAELAVFDVTGRSVATLALGETGAGGHSFEWNSATVEPGVYLLRLTAAGQTTSQRIVVAR